MSAVGFIETRGRVGAVVAMDTALKTSELKLIALNRVSGGLVSVIVEGETAAVESAIKSAKIEAEKVCKRVRITLVPNLSREVREELDKLTTRKRNLILED